MSASNYDFSENTNEPAEGHSKPNKSLRQTYGRIPVVEASFNLLFRFLVNQIYWYANQTGDENKQTINWAKNLVSGDPSPLYKYYSKLFDTIKGATEEFPHSGTVRLTSVYQEDKNKFYVRFIFSKNEITKRFLESKNLTYQQFMEQNGLTLAESNPTHVLHQMTQRLGSLVYRLEGSKESDGAASCDYDFSAIETFKTVQDFFYQLLQEAKLHMSQFKRSITTTTTDYHQKQSSSVSQKKNTTSVPKKSQTSAPKSAPVVTAPQVPKPSTSTFVSKNVSYASVMTGKKSETVDRSQNKFAALAGDTELVDDLDIQEIPKETKSVPAQPAPPASPASPVSPAVVSETAAVVKSQSKPKKKSKKSKATENTAKDNAKTEVTKPVPNAEQKVLIYVPREYSLNGAPEMVPKYVSKQFVDQLLKEETNQAV